MSSVALKMLQGKLEGPWKEMCFSVILKGMKLQSLNKPHSIIFSQTMDFKYFLLL